MTIALTHLDANNNTDVSSISTASVSPSTDALVLASVTEFNTSTPPTVSVSGCGLTWVLIATITTTYSRLSIFRAMGSPTSGAVTADAGATQSLIQISVDELTGVDTSGSNGSGAIVQSNTSSNSYGTTAPVSLSAFSDSGNVSYGSFFGYYGATPVTWTPGSGFTEVYEGTNFCSVWQTADADPTATANISCILTGIGLEIAIASGGAAYTLTAAQGSYTESGQTSAILADRLLAFAQGSFSESGQPTSLVTGRKVSAVQGSYSQTGQQAGLQADRLLGFAYGAYSQTGQSVNFITGKSISLVQGSFGLTGEPVNFERTRKILAAQGSFVESGQSSNLTRGARLVQGLGVYTLSGQEVLTKLSRLISGENGTLTLSGFDTNLLKGLIMVATGGGFSSTGFGLNLLLTRRLAATFAQFDLSGQTVLLTYETVGAYTLTAAQGSFTESGQAVFLRLARLASIGAGFFSLTGQESALLADRNVVANRGTFSVSPFDTNLVAGRVMPIGGGSLSLTGEQIAFLLARVIGLNNGSFSLNGEAVTLTYDKLASGFVTVNPTFLNNSLTFDKLSTPLVIKPLNDNLTL